MSPVSTDNHLSLIIFYDETIDIVLGSSILIFYRFLYHIFSIYRFQLHFGNH